MVWKYKLTRRVWLKAQ